jgi:hypothetical protein
VQSRVVAPTVHRGWVARRQSGVSRTLEEAAHRAAHRTPVAPLPRGQPDHQRRGIVGRGQFKRAAWRQRAGANDRRQSSYGGSQCDRWNSGSDSCRTQAGATGGTTTASGGRTSGSGGRTNYDGRRYGTRPSRVSCQSEIAAAVRNYSLGLAASGCALHRWVRVAAISMEHSTGLRKACRKTFAISGSAKLVD